MADALAHLDPQLVKLITQTVMQRLQAHATAAQIKPPAGLCTAGERKPSTPASTPAPQPTPVVYNGLSGGVIEETPAFKPAISAAEPVAGPARSVKVHASESAKPQPVYSVLRGFVTAQAIEDAVAEHGTARLAIDARLTPLADDFVRANPARVQRVSDQGAVAAGHQGQWLLWSQAFCPTVQAQAQRLHQHLVPASVRSDGAITDVADQAAQGIALGRLAGGVLFVRQRAAALCLLNRYRDIRAAGANCLEELEQAIAGIGVNVLVVELPRVTAKTMAALLDRLLVSNPAMPHAYASLLRQGVSR